jgi:endonuclease YncB( thermonuclease family)
MFQKLYTILFGCTTSSSILVKEEPTNISHIQTKIFDTKSFIDSTEDLKKLSIKWENTKAFVPPIQCGLVIKVYDGDTMTIATRLPYQDSTLYRFSIRLNGIDCPEIKGRNDDESHCAILARNILSDLVLHKFVTLKNISLEKYGRILADVYIDDLHVNNYMIQQRVAVPYNGKTKSSPSNWMEYYLM